MHTHWNFTFSILHTVTLSSHHVFKCSYPQIYSYVNTHICTKIHSENAPHIYTPNMYLTTLSCIQMHLDTNTPPPTHSRNPQQILLLTPIHTQTFANTPSNSHPTILIDTIRHAPVQIHLQFLTHTPSLTLITPCTKHKHTAMHTHKATDTHTIFSGYRSLNTKRMKKHGHTHTRAVTVTP